MLKTIPDIQEFFHDFSYIQNADGSSIKDCRNGYLSGATRSYSVFKISNPHLLPQRFRLLGNFKIVYWSNLEDTTVIVDTAQYPLIWIFYWITLRWERSLDVLTYYFRTRGFSIRIPRRYLFRFGILHYLNNTIWMTVIRYLWREWTR